MALGVQDSSRYSSQVVSWLLGYSIMPGDAPEPGKASTMSLRHRHVKKGFSSGVGEGAGAGPQGAAALATVSVGLKPGEMTKLERQLFGSRMQQYLRSRCGHPLPGSGSVVTDTYAPLGCLPATSQCCGSTLQPCMWVCMMQGQDFDQMV